MRMTKERAIMKMKRLSSILDGMANNVFEPLTEDEERLLREVSKSISKFADCFYGEF